VVSIGTGSGLELLLDQIIVKLTGSSPYSPYIKTCSFTFYLFCI